MQISPHIEPAQFDYAPMPVARPSPAPEPERVYQTDTKPVDEPDEVSEEKQGFAEILAGLLYRNDGEGTLEEVEGDTGVLLAVDDDFSIEAELGFGDASMNIDDDEAEFSPFDFSDSNLNLLTGAQQALLLNAEQNLTETDTDALAEAKVEVDENLAGDVRKVLAELKENAENVNAGFTDTEAEEAALAVEAEKQQKNNAAELQAKGKQRTAQNEAALAAALANGKKVETPADLREAQNVLLRKNDGKESRLEEVRGQKRRPVTVDVKDMRVGSGEVRSSSEVQFNAGLEKSMRVEGTPREITLELRMPDQPKVSTQGNQSWEVKAGQAMENMLARELHQNFNNDIVRHASMLLKSDGQGTIRLNLHPESLGNVKIRLEMAENKITGHIVVESEEALRAFEREIHSLEQAFKDSGFAAADLEMSLANNGRGAEQWQQDQEASAFIAHMNSASQYEAHEVVETPHMGIVERGQNSINVLV